MLIGAPETRSVTGTATTTEAATTSDEGSMSMAEVHPSDHHPVQEEYRVKMAAMARLIDEHFNGEKATRDGPRSIGFALLVFPFTDLGKLGKGEDRINYMSNAERVDMLTAMKEFIARAEGRMQGGGNA
jgi:hypothetical protein